MSIPRFDRHGNLPPGEHRATWVEFSARFGYNRRRAKLVAMIKAWLEQVQAAGCRTAYIDGSFVCAKAEPGDFDACWDVTGVNRARIDPRLLDLSEAGRAEIKRVYGGDIFPDRAVAPGSILAFVRMFQIDRDGRAKGIVRFDLRETDL